MLTECLGCHVHSLTRSFGGAAAAWKSLSNLSLKTYMTLRNQVILSATGEAP